MKFFPYAVIFDITVIISCQSFIIKLAQKHLQKLDTGNSIYYNRQLTELIGMIHEDFPARMTLPEQGAFEIGYYHQTQKRYEKRNKEESENV